MFCTNKEKGCEWQGEVNDIINHLGNSDGCQFQDVTCSNDCGKCLQRQCLTGHVENECVRRKVDCQYCHITGEHQFIEGEHKEQCPKLPIVCPNKCEADNMLREEINEHRKMCPLEEVTCPNGCETTLKRQQLPNHVENECPCRKVDCQYCHITGEHQFIEGEHKEQCPKFPIACPNKCEVGSVPRDDVEEHMKMCPLELIQCEYHVVGCEERMARKDQKKHNKEKMEEHLFLSVNKVAKISEILTKTEKEQKETKDELTNTERDLNTTKQQLSKNLAKAEKEHVALAAVLAKLETKFQTKITEIETIAQERITELERTLEQVVMANELKGTPCMWMSHLNTASSKLSSGDQVVPVIVKISEYTKKKRDKVEIFCDPFYTHNKGYKVCLCVYSRDYGNRYTHTHLSVYLMKGPYDDQLRWPLNGHCEVKLLNQIGDSKHHFTVVNKNSVGYRVYSGERSKNCLCYRHDFISNEDLHKITPTHQYLKDDSIFLQVDYKL